MEKRTLTSVLLAFRNAVNSEPLEDATLALLAEANDLVMADDERAILRALVREGRAGGVFVVAAGRGDFAGGQIAAFVLAEWAAIRGGDGDLARRLGLRDADALVNGLLALENSRAIGSAQGALAELTTRTDQAARWALDTILLYTGQAAPE